MSAPTPPPSSQPSGAPQAGPSFNIGAWSIFDKIALGSGALFFLFSFFNRFRSVDLGNVFGTNLGTVGISAWHSYAVAGLLIALVALVLVALKALQPSILPAGIPWPLVTAGAAALGWFIVLLRGLTYDGGSVGWSGWIVFIVGLVYVAATVIPLTSAAGNVEAKLNDAAGKLGGSGN